MTTGILEQPESGQVPAPAPAAAPPRPKRPRLYALDGLRMIAALSVVSWHWLGVQKWTLAWGGKTGAMAPLGHAIGAYGWTGVELFFLISGFVICMSSWDRSLGQFLTSRVVRLFPAYWIGVLLTSIVLLVLPSVVSTSTPRPTPSRILSNLTMVHESFSVGDIDASYWSLWTELRFYIIFGVVIAMGLTYRRVLVFCGIWGFASLVTMQSHSALLNVLVMPDYSWYFIGGISLFLMYKFRPNLLLWGILGFCWLMAQNRIEVLVKANSGGAREHLSWSVTVALITLAFALVTATALGYLNWVRWKGLTAIGAMTYPLYVIHQAIGLQLIHRVSRHLSPYPTVLVCLAVMLTAAWLIHRLVERPLAPWMKRKLTSSFEAVRGDLAGAGTVGHGRSGPPA